MHDGQRAQRLQPRCHHGLKAGASQDPLLLVWLVRGSANIHVHHGVGLPQCACAVRELCKMRHKLGLKQLTARNLYHNSEDLTAIQL